MNGTKNNKTDKIVINVAWKKMTSKTGYFFRRRTKEMAAKNNEVNVINQSIHQRINPLNDQSSWSSCSQTSMLSKSASSRVMRPLTTQYSATAKQQNRYCSGIWMLWQRWDRSFSTDWWTSTSPVSSSRRKQMSRAHNVPVNVKEYVQNTDFWFDSIFIIMLYPFIILKSSKKY